MTPLVGWLKPWMLPEILNVNIPMKYLYEQGFYTSSQQFIQKFNEKHNFKSSIKKDDNVKNVDKVSKDVKTQTNMILESAEELS